MSSFALRWNVAGVLTMTGLYKNHRMRSIFVGIRLKVKSHLIEFKNLNRKFIPNYLTVVTAGVGCLPMSTIYLLHPTSMFRQISYR